MAIKRGNNSGGGGGRGGNGGGNNQGDDGGQGDDGDGEDVTELVNAAVASHIGRKLPTMLAPIVAKAVTEAVPAILEQMGIQPQQNQGQGQQANQGQGNQQNQGGQGQGNQQGGQGQQANQGQGNQQNQGGGESQAVAALTRQLEDMRKQMKAAQEATAAQEAETRNTRRDAALTEGLAKLGVDKHRMRGALAIAREAMVWDAEAATPTGGKGAWVWRAQRNGYHEDLPIEQGLGEWGKTDEGRSYIAPQQGRQGGGGVLPQRRQQQGQGGNLPRTGGGQQQGQGGQDKAARVEQATNDLFNMFAQGGGLVSLGGGE